VRHGDVGKVVTVVTVLFVHGTGVRAASSAATLKAIRAGLARVRPDARVEPCDWGTALGSYLRAGGASIPGYREYAAASGLPEAEPDEGRARWAMLYADPFAELSVYALTDAAGTTDTSFTPGRADPGDRLIAALAQVNGSGAVAAAWSAVAPDRSPGEAVASLLAAPEPRRAFARAAAVTDDLARLTARALTAWALTHSAEGPAAVAAADRDELADVLTAELGGDVRGLGSALVAALGFSARLFERSLGSRLLVSRRAALSGHSVGAVGDILSYLSRGQEVREYLAAAIRALEGRGPVVVLGHSLGGIVAVDLLAGRSAAGPPVDLLVTVGSQAPLLYELDALPSRPYGTGLPAAFPRWLNVYDRRDLLSYLAAGAFAGDSRITDVPVDNRQPVSAAHSAYWANRDFYRILAEALPD
jgi:hypothetical protein